MINAYTLETGISLSAQDATTSFTDSFRGLGANGRFADQPTITYTPLSGERFARSVMRPIPLSALLLLAQGGYPIDQVLRVCVRAINGLHNSYGGYAARAGDPKFHELLNLLREQQAAGGAEFQLRGEGEEKQDIVLSVRPPSDDAMAARRARIAALLGVSTETSEYRVVFGTFPANDKEVAIQTRSMLQVLADLASYVDVPPGDIAEERVHVPPRTAEQERLFPALLRVRYAEAPPPRDAYVAVRYRERWFWIDDRDRGSKAALSFVMLMFSLSETDAPAAPMLTIPAR